MRSLDPGHTCVRLPETTSRMRNGTQATLQIIYLADWDSTSNQTFYACSDIVYVDAAEFTGGPRCFNATEPGEDDKKAAAAAAGGSGSGSGSSSGSSGSSDAASSSGGSSSGLGARGMAGAIVGPIVGVCVIAALGLLLYRRREQKKRALRLARMEENAKTAAYHDTA